MSEAKKSPEVADLKPEDVVTQEIINGILKSLDRPELALVDYKAELGTSVGDNFMSLMYAVKLNMKNSNTGEKETVPVMLKVLPQNEARIKTVTDGNMFAREICFYEKIAPAMEQFQRDRGLSEKEIFTPWPKCYASKTDGKGDFLAMEDVKVQGFKMANRKLGLDLEHCKLMIKTLARFHAISYAMFQGDFDKLLEKYPLLEETVFNEEKSDRPALKGMFKNIFAKQASMIRGTGDEETASRMEGLYTDDLFSKLHKIMGGKVKWAVIGHGDSWTNNILFRYDEETNKPVEIKLVDFQISKIASRAVDIHYFLYSSPQIQVLNDNEGELEQIYYDEFTASVKKLGVDVDADGLTKKNFIEEIATMRYYGCVAGLMLAMITTPETAMGKVKNIAGLHLPKCPQLNA